MMLAMLKSTNEFKIPKIDEVSEKFRSLSSKELELAGEQELLEAEARDLQAKSSLNNRQLPKDLAERLRLTRVASALGEASPDFQLIPAERAIEIRERLALLKEARAELEKRKIDEITAASAKIRSMIAPEHRRLVLDICNAFVTLHEASRAYHEFVDALNGDGVQWAALWPMHPTFLGDPRDTHCRIACYLREARDKEFLPASKVPERFR